MVLTPLSTIFQLYRGHCFIILVVHIFKFSYIIDIAGESITTKLDPYIQMWVIFTNHILIRSHLQKY